ncbi:MAG: TatD family hydrolase [Clostridia bacterium]|nr:TatD family hydrolase [Clostridia bacterium]
MIDTHAHYTHQKFNVTSDYRFLSCDGENCYVKTGRLGDVFRDMKEAGIDAVVEPAIGIESNRAILEEYRQNRGFIYPAVGVHPETAGETPRGRRRELADLIASEGVVAVGETGLDYHLPKFIKSRFAQRFWFRYQIRAAYRAGLPLILHIRDADREALAVLRRRRKKIHGGVVHCFSGDADAAREYLALGLYIGIGGGLIEHGKMSERLREAVKIIPAERILLETDAPYMAPGIEIDGKRLSDRVRNTSSVIRAVAAEIARLKGTTPEEVIAASDTGAKALFGIRIEQ